MARERKTQSIGVPAQSDLDLDGSDLLSTQKDELGYVIRYSCDKLVENNYVTPISVSYFYDLVFESTEDSLKTRRHFEYLLLKTVAREYGLDNGNACISPSDTHTLYPVMLTSLPDDETNENLDKCLDLSPSSHQKCTSYMGKLTGFVAGVDDVSELTDIIASSLSDGTVTKGTTMQVAFLGTQIEANEGRDSLNSAVNSAEKESISGSNSANQLTTMGMFLTIALCSAFAGLLIVIWRMRQRKQQQIREAIAFEDNRSPEDNKHIDDSDDGLIDIGHSMKVELWNIHGGVSSPRRATPSASHSVASEEDSWAQADATLTPLGRHTKKMDMNEVGEI